jgi:hypothetical protein
MMKFPNLLRMSARPISIRATKIDDSGELHRPSLRTFSMKMLAMVLGKGPQQNLKYARTHVRTCALLFRFLLFCQGEVAGSRVRSYGPKLDVSAWRKIGWTFNLSTEHQSCSVSLLDFNFLKWKGTSQRHHPAGTYDIKPKPELIPCLQPEFRRSAETIFKIRASNLTPRRSKVEKTKN